MHNAENSKQSLATLDIWHVIIFLGYQVLVLWLMLLWCGKHYTYFATRDYITVMSNKDKCIELAHEGERRCKSGDYVAGVKFYEAAVNHGTGK